MRGVPFSETHLINDYFTFLLKFYRIEIEVQTQVAKRLQEYLNSMRGPIEQTNAQISSLVSEMQRSSGSALAAAAAQSGLSSSLTAHSLPGTPVRHAADTAILATSTHADTMRARSELTLPLPLTPAGVADPLRMRSFSGLAESPAASVAGAAALSYSAAATAGVGPSGRAEPSQPQRFASTATPSTALVFRERDPSPANLREPLRPMTEFIAEKELRGAREKIAELNERMRDVTQRAEQDRKNFKRVVEEMRTKLGEMEQSRDAVIAARDKELEAQQTLVAKLQQSVLEIQERSRAQEETLAAANRRLEQSAQTTAQSETALRDLSHLHQRLRLVLITRLGRVAPEAGAEPTTPTALFAGVELVSNALLEELNARDKQLAEQQLEIERSTEAVQKAEEERGFLENQLDAAIARTNEHTEVLSQAQREIERLRSRVQQLTYVCTHSLYE